MRGTLTRFCDKFQRLHITPERVTKNNSFMKLKYDTLTHFLLKKKINTVVCGHNETARRKSLSEKKAKKKKGKIFHIVTMLVTPASNL